MKIKEYVEKIKRVEVVLDVLCNMCGGSLFRGTDSTKEIYGLVNLSYSGGYESGPQIKDEEHLMFSLCENCIGTLVNQFKIPAKDTWLYKNNYVANSSRSSHVEQSLAVIYKINNKQDLAKYLVDNDSLVREYANLRLTQLNLNNEEDSGNE